MEIPDEDIQAAVEGTKRAIKKAQEYAEEFRREYNDKTAVLIWQLRADERKVCLAILEGLISRAVSTVSEEQS